MKTACDFMHRSDATKADCLKENTLIEKIRKFFDRDDVSRPIAGK